MKAASLPPSTVSLPSTSSSVGTSCRASPHQAWVHSQPARLPSRRSAPAFPRGHGLRPARDCRVCSFPMRSPQLDTEAEVAVVYDRLRVLRSRLDAAVASEDYALAAKLRDDSKAALALLQPAQQYVFHQLDTAKSSNSSTEEKLKAIASIGQVADEYVIAELAVLLQDESLQDAAAAAMWDVFLRWRDPKVVEMMSEGCRLMNNPARYEHALQIFNQLIMLAPSYVESRNKRATVLYQMGRYQESVDDCEVVLDMQPYHFGAASGMGLCYLQMGKPALALQAFERALKIHPGMRNIRFVAEKLREEA